MGGWPDGAGVLSAELVPHRTLTCVRAHAQAKCSAHALRCTKALSRAQERRHLVSMV